MPQGATFKVPRLYKAAEKIARQVKEDNANLDDLLKEYNKKTNVKALGALVTKTISNEVLLDNIIAKSKILVQEKNANPWLFRILITELLLGKQRLPVGNESIQKVLSYGPVLRTEFLRAQGKFHLKQEQCKTEEHDSESEATAGGKNESDADQEKKTPVTIDLPRKTKKSKKKRKNKSEEKSGNTVAAPQLTIKSEHGEEGKEQDNIKLEGEPDVTEDSASESRLQGKRYRESAEENVSRKKAKWGEQQDYIHLGNNSSSGRKNKQHFKKKGKRHAFRTNKNKQ